MLDVMTLDQLRAFVAVAEDGSFSAAGRRLSRVQSAVSQSVQSLETGLGVQLFNRTLRTPVLTEAGRTILVQARQVLLEAAALRAQAAALDAGMEPELTLAVDNLFPSPPLLASLKALRAQFPDLPVTLYTAPIFAAERRLREGMANISLCGHSPGVYSYLVASPLTEIQMTPVAAPAHPLARHRGKLSKEMLGRHVQLVLTDPSAAADSPSFGVISSRVWKFVDISWRREYLLAGFGWCNMPDHLVAPSIEAGDLTALSLEEPGLLPRFIPICAVHPRARPPGPAGRWFLDHLMTAFRNPQTRAKRL